MSSSDRHALVVCDLQQDVLKSLPHSNTLVDSIGIAVDVARRADWTVIFTGLKFKSGYEGVSPNHKLYGALQRLNAKVGDAHAHWFMQGYEGSDIVIPTDENSVTVWRSSHLPSKQVLQELTSRSITKATIVGVKAAYAIQATVQALCDDGLQVSIVDECISDDDEGRLKAIMKHVVPIYADVMSLEEFVDETVGLESYEKIVAAEAESENDITSKAFYISDCGRGGHCALYASYLLKKTGWRRYPLQKWYTDGFTNRQYSCPLGKKVVDFCDEPQFSKVSMYLKGREWLDEKEKVMEIAKDLMPETYVIESGAWLNDKSPDIDSEPGPWFVKECDKNGGRAVQICLEASECMALADPKSSYVVQAHIAKPLLTDDGRKCHIKFYSLLQCGEDGVSWSLHTYQDAFLCTSPNPWSAKDISNETQVTIKRHKRMRAGEDIEGWNGWPAAYNKCKEGVATVVERAIKEGKMLGRPAKKQFEIFSADFMLDTDGKAWLIEFNFGPVMFDPLADQELTTAGLKEYQRLYELQGNKAAVNDSAMIRDAVSMVFFPD